MFNFQEYIQCIMDTLGHLKLVLKYYCIMEVKQYTKVLAWDGNKCP